LTATSPRPHRWPAFKPLQHTSSALVWMSFNLSTKQPAALQPIKKDHLIAASAISWRWISTCLRHCGITRRLDDYCSGSSRWGRCF